LDWRWAWCSLRDMLVRLHKLMADRGAGSRRTCEEYIAQGRVTVNGRPAAIGLKVDSSVDVVAIDGRSLPSAPASLRHVMLNKPAGYVTTCSDRHAEHIVTELVDVPERLFPVGRLDAETEGLLLLTNDGELANRLTHPRYEIPKVYDVIVEGDLDADQLRAVERGIEVDGSRTAPCRIRGIRRRRSRNETQFHLSLIEGRKRQIRRMFESIGRPVRRIVRLRIGPLAIGDLPTGQWRDLTEREVADLRAATGLIGGG
jgi:23S rRNA pseudouridine2605 synthase